MLRRERITGTQGSRRDDILIAAAGVIPVVWAALKIAPFWGKSLFEMTSQMDVIFAEPWHIEWTRCSLEAVLFCLLVYAMAIGIWLSTKRNYRRGEEHGSAKWGDARAVDRKYHQKPDSMNKILTQHVRIGFDAHKHRRNLNVLVIGGSGAGKTRGYVKPNVMQAAYAPEPGFSMILTDPNGETNYSHFFITFFQRREMQ